MKVIYPVLFYEEKEGGYSVFVPDLKNNSTCGSTLEEAMTMAEDLIAGIVLDEMEENNQIPKSSKIEDVSFEKLEKYLDIENWDYVCDPPADFLEQCEKNWSGRSSFCGTVERKKHHQVW